MKKTQRGGYYCWADARGEPDSMRGIADSRSWAAGDMEGTSVAQSPLIEYTLLSRKCRTGQKMSEREGKGRARGDGFIGHSRGDPSNGAGP